MEMCCENRNEEAEEQSVNNCRTVSRTNPIYGGGIFTQTISSQMNILDKASVSL